MYFFHSGKNNYTFHLHVGSQSKNIILLTLIHGGNNTILFTVIYARREKHFIVGLIFTNGKERVCICFWFKKDANFLKHEKCL